MSKKILRVVLGLGLVAMLAVAVAVFFSATTPVAEAAGGPGGQPCGGFAGLQCPNPNQICIDDPRDDCDPKKGGADCIGICRGPGGGGNTQ